MYKENARVIGSLMLPCFNTIEVLFCRKNYSVILLSTDIEITHRIKKTGFFLYVHNLNDNFLIQKQYLFRCATHTVTRVIHLNGTVTLTSFAKRLSDKLSTAGLLLPGIEIRSPACSTASFHEMY